MTFLDGVDISYAQDVTPNLTSLAFAIVKASEGNFKDFRWDQHSNAVLSHSGMGLGAYHFGRREWAVGVQVSKFLSVSEPADFLALDYEHSTKHTLMTERQARDFITAVKAHEAAGRKRPVGLYGSEYNPWPSFPSDLWGADFAWIANTSKEPIHPYTFWQWTFSPLDRDRFNGDQAALAKFLGRPQGGVVSMTNRSGYPKNLAVKQGDPFYAKAGDTAPIGHYSADTSIVVQGRVIDPGGGWYEAWTTTSAGYPDHVDRPSGVYLHLTEPVAWLP